MNEPAATIPGRDAGKAFPVPEIAGQGILGGRWMGGTLILQSGDRAGETFHLGRRVTVGSGADSHIRLHDLNLSSHHFTIEQREGVSLLQDAGSGGGTFVDGERIRETALKDRTTIYAGDTVFFYRSAEDVSPGLVESVTAREDLSENEVRRMYESSVISLVDDRASLPRRDDGAPTPLEALYRIGRLLGSGEELNLLFEHVVAVVGDVLGAGRSLLMLYDGERSAWKSAAVWSRSSTSPLEAGLPSAVLHETLRSGMSMLIHDTARDGRFKGVSEIRSVLCVPLRAHRRTLGVLWADTPSPDRGFDEDDLLLLTAIGRHAGGGIERRMLEQELWEHSQTLEARVANRTRELEETLDHLTRTQAELVHASKQAAVGLLATGIAHNMNTPLAGIKGFAEILVSRHPELVEAKKILASARRLEEIVETLLTKGRRENQEESTTFSPGDLIRDTLAFLEGDLFFKHQVTKVVEVADPLPRVRAVYSDFSQSLQNLVVNAAEALQEAPGERTIIISAGRDGGAVFIDVSDTGVGIPADIRPKLFTPFFTTRQEGSRPDGRGGSGLGLYTVSRLLKPYGATVTLRPGGGGTTFRITLPPSCLVEDPSDE